MPLKYISTVQVSYFITCLRLGTYIRTEKSDYVYGMYMGLAVSRLKTIPLQLEMSSSQFYFCEIYFIGVC